MKDFSYTCLTPFEARLNIILLLQGKTLRCSLSESKNRLFIGNVPKSWTEDEFRKVIEDVGPGVENIELIKVGLDFGSSLEFCCG